MLYLTLVCCLFLLTTSLANKCPIYPLPQPVSFNNPILQQFVKGLDVWINDYVTAQKISGFMATIVYDQQIIFAQGYGKKNFFDPQSPPPDLDTMTRVASISKPFTDLMLFIARDRGLVNMDDPVSKYLPQFSIKDPYNTDRPITLRELASHTAALPREIPCGWSALPICTEKEILERLSQQYVITPQYVRPHYSNLGIALLGRTLERAVGKRYEDYAKEVMFKPLGMNYSTFDYDDFTKKHLGVGVRYYRNGTAYPAVVRDLKWGNPMGGMFASSRDIASFMSFLFRDNQRAGPNQPLDSSTINEFLKPIILQNDGKSGYGIPWELNYTSSHWVISKAGQLNGYRSQMSMLPEFKLGVFTTAFQSSVSDPTVLTIPITEKLITTFTQILTPLQPTPELPSNANLFLGTYHNKYDSGDVTTIYISQNILYAKTQDETVILTSFEKEPLALRMTILDPTNYSCRGLNDGIESELIYFTLNAQKDHATQIIIMGETYLFSHP